MFRTIVLSAAIAGIAAGLLISAIQSVTTTPLILAAETYEHPSAAPAAPRAPAAFAPHSHGAAASVHDHGVAADDGWKPTDGIERLAYTTLADVLAGIGFGLILTACFAFSGRPVDGRTGLMWGAAGYAVFALAPNLGLPPELPGTAAPDLAARQLWWLCAAAGTAAGLWLLAFRRGVAARAAGIVLLILPHAIGAPEAERLTGAVPPELAARFAAASLATAAVFWLVLGGTAGAVYGRIRRPVSGSAPAYR